MDYNNDSESKGIKAIEKFNKKMETDADEQFIHGIHNKEGIYNAHDKTHDLDIIRDRIKDTTKEQIEKQ